MNFTGDDSHDEVVYTQCQLRNGNRLQTSWLPVIFARRGRTLKLRSKDGTWTDGWVVSETYGTTTIRTSIPEILG